MRADEFVDRIGAAIDSASPLYWIEGFSTSQMKRVQNELKSRRPDSNIVGHDLTAGENVDPDVFVFVLPDGRETLNAELQVLLRSGNYRRGAGRFRDGPTTAGADA